MSSTISILLILLVIPLRGRAGNYPEILDYYKAQTNALKGLYTPIVSVSETSEENREYSTDVSLNKIYKEIRGLPENSDDDLSIKLKKLEEFHLKVSKKNELKLEMAILLDIFNINFWGESPHYTEAFVTAIKLEQKLEILTEELSFDKKKIYQRVGEAYFLFNDFQKSICLLQQAIESTDSTHHFTGDTKLNALKTLGLCYTNTNQIDLSDSYFRSILHSKDSVPERSLYNAYALSYLGYNALLRGEYEKTLAFNDSVLPFFKERAEFAHITEIYLWQSMAYFYKGEHQKARDLADSTLCYSRIDTIKNTYNRYQSFNKLAVSNWLKGDINIALAYNDSLLNIYKNKELEFSFSHINNAHQIVLKEKILEVEKQICSNKRQVHLLICVLLIILGYTYYLYRKKRIVSYISTEENAEYAESVVEKVPTSKRIVTREVSDKDLEIMTVVHDYIVIKKNFLNPELTLELLAKNININKKYISAAINKVEKMNFNLYLNKYRIDEAIRMLSSYEYDQYSIDAISSDAGFNSRRPFYEYFKKLVDVSPSDFRKSRILDSVK